MSFCLSVSKKYSEVRFVKPTLLDTNNVEMHFAWVFFVTRLKYNTFSKIQNYLVYFKVFFIRIHNFKLFCLLVSKKCSDVRFENQHFHIKVSLKCISFRFFCHNSAKIQYFFRNPKISCVIQRSYGNLYKSSHSAF